MIPLTVTYVIIFPQGFQGNAPLARRDPYSAYNDDGEYAPARPAVSAAADEAR